MKTKIHLLISQCLARYYSWNNISSLFPKWWRKSFVMLTKKKKIAGKKKRTLCKLAQSLTEAFAVL